MPFSYTWSYPGIAPKTLLMIGMTIGDGFCWRYWWLGSIENHENPGGWSEGVNIELVIISYPGGWG